MREIKFRAWDGHNMWHDIQDAYDGEKGLPENSFGLFIGRGNYCRTPTHTYAVMQYTGMEDKNGVEIYEGDICEASWGYCHPRKAVEFEQLFWERGEGMISDDIEVIGNVHENPELLNDAKEWLELVSNGG